MTDGTGGGAAPPDDGSHGPFGAPPGAGAAAVTDGAMTCQLCGVPLQPATALAVGGHLACARCVEQLQYELQEREADGSVAPMGVVGALLGAFLGAAVWIGIAIASDFEIGYIAVLVGYLAGKGAVMLTGGRHGQLLQVLAVVGALIGLLAAKYFTFAHYFREYALEEHGASIGYFAPETLETFPLALPDMLSAFDLLWIFLAVTAAWRVPASPQLAVARAAVGHEGPAGPAMQTAPERVEGRDA